MSDAQTKHPCSVLAFYLCNLKGIMLEKETPHFSLVSYPLPSLPWIPCANNLLRDNLYQNSITLHLDGGSVEGPSIQAYPKEQLL